MAINLYIKSKTIIYVDMFVTILIRSVTLKIFLHIVIIVELVITEGLTFIQTEILTIFHCSQRAVHILISSILLSSKKNFPKCYCTIWLHISILLQSSLVYLATINLSRDSVIAHP